MSCLKPRESLKIPSKAYDLIASQIRSKIEDHSLTLNVVNDIQGHQSKVKSWEDLFNHIEASQNEKLNNTQESEDDCEYEDKVLSKFVVIERYDPTKFMNIKQAINRELVTSEVNKEVYKRHYLDELNRWQKGVLVKLK